MLDTMILQDISIETYNAYYGMVELFQMIAVWWIKEVEVPTSGINGMTSDSEIWIPLLETIKIMTDVAFTGNEEYLQKLKKMDDMRYNWRQD